MSEREDPSSLEEALVQLYEERRHKNALAAGQAGVTHAMALLQAETREQAARLEVAYRELDEARAERDRQKARANGLDALLERDPAHLSARPPEVDREECVYCGPDGDCEYGHEHLSARPPGDALNRTERDTARTALQHLAPWAVALLDAGLVRNERGWSRADGRLALFQEHWMTGSDTVVWRVANGTAFVYGLEESAALAWLATQGGDRG